MILNQEHLNQIKSAAKTLQTGSTGIAGWDGGRAHVQYHPRIQSAQQMRLLASTMEDLPEILLALVAKIESVTSDDMIEKFAAVPTTWTRTMYDGYPSTGWRAAEDVARDTLDVVRSTINEAKDIS